MDGIGDRKRESKRERERSIQKEKEKERVPLLAFPKASAIVAAREDIRLTIAKRKRRSSENAVGEGKLPQLQQSPSDPNTRGSRQNEEPSNPDLLINIRNKDGTSAANGSFKMMMPVENKIGNNPREKVPVDKCIVIKRKDRKLRVLEETCACQNTCPRETEEAMNKPACLATYDRETYKLDDDVDETESDESAPNREKTYPSGNGKSQKSVRSQRWTNHKDEWNELFR